MENVKAKCKVCGKYVSKIYTHMESHKSGTFKCNFCQRESDTLAKHNAHKREHTHSYIRDLVKCDKCDLKLQRRTLKNHMKRLHPLGDPTFECQFCKSKYFLKSDYTKHLRAKHDNNKPYIKCEYCNKIFTEKVGLCFI